MSRIRLLEMIETCRNEGRHLTKWEENFLDSMQERLEYNRTLSEREEEILTKIFTEKTDG